MLLLSYSLWTTNWRLASNSLRIKSCVAAAAGFQYPPERSSEWRAEMRHCVLRENLPRQIFRYLDIFQGKILWALFLHLLVSSKTLKSFMLMTNSLWLAIPFWKKENNNIHINTYMCVPDCMHSSFTKITSLLRELLTFWSSLSEVSEMLSPRL